MKVIYNEDTKRFADYTSYAELAREVSRAFNLDATLIKGGASLKFFYVDQDGDMISITTENDLKEAIREISDGRLKLGLAENLEKAKSILGLGAQFIDSSRFESQKTIGTTSSNQFNINFIDEKLPEVVAEPIKKAEENPPLSSMDWSELDKDSHSIACGGDDQTIDDIPTSSQATDARDMVKELNQKNAVQNSFGCNTEATKTSEKLIDAICTTNEIGSQAKVKFKEVMCNTKINTETQACQKDTIGTEKEVSCLILGPGDINQDVGLSDDMPDCFRCDGAKVNKKGLPCKKCNATGKLQTKFFRDLNKILQVEVNKYCTQQYQKMLTDHLEQKKKDQAEVLHPNCICDGCDQDPIKGIRYQCSSRQDYDLCEKCEARLQPLPYPMIKIRHPRHAPQKIICQYDYQLDQKLGGGGRVNQINSNHGPNQIQNNVGYASGGIATSSFNVPILERPNSKCVTHPEKMPVISCGKGFELSWVFQNTGNTVWPANTVFQQVSGDDLGCSNCSIGRAVHPNETQTVVLKLRSPEEPGKVHAFFRLAHTKKVPGGKVEFGEKVWLDFECTKFDDVFGKKIELQESIACMVEEPDKLDMSILEPIIEDVKPTQKIQIDSAQDSQILLQQKASNLYDDKDKSMVQSQVIVQSVYAPTETKPDPVKVSCLKESEINKISYIDQLDSANFSADYKNSLIELMQMGFLDFNKNLLALQKNYNNLELAIDSLSK